MVFDWFNVNTPYSWCFLASLFLGAAIDRIFARRPGPARWTFAYLYLSVAFAAAAGGVLVPPSGEILNLRLAYFAAAFLVIGFFSFRYAANCGAPLLLLAIVGLVLLAVGLEGWRPLSGTQAKVASIEVLGTRPGRASLRIVVSREEASVSGSLPSERMRPVVAVMHVNPAYFFIASPLLYRFEGVEAGGQGAPAGAVGSAGPSKDESAALGFPASALARGLAGLAARLPGVRGEVLHGAAIRTAALENYTVELRHGPSVAVIPASP